MRLMDVMCGIGTTTIGACVGGFLAFVVLASGSASICIRTYWTRQLGRPITLYIALLLLSVSDTTSMQCVYESTFCT